jgi:crossover junction endodeoxyribonuclease RusA
MPLTESRTLTLTLPYPPSANRYWRNYRGITVTSEEARAYKQEVGYRARTAGLTPLQGDVILRLDIYRPRKVGDLDNRIKLLIDSLNGFAWGDDSQIVEIHARRFDDKKQPRVDVTIEGA